MITTPKTRSSKNGVAISPRVAALQRRARSSGRTHSSPSALFTGLVFCRPDGRPLRPSAVLARLRQLSDEAGVPRVTVHDLRHLAATLTITAGVPLTAVSKTLRHSTLSTTASIYGHLTASIYGHLTQQAAREAVDTLEHTLTWAEQRAEGQARPKRPRSSHDHIQRLREALHRPPARLRLPREPSPDPACDHSATTSPPGTRKAALP
ncbi:tyrosine-type recombinase/integrase [Streptomyces sp. NPDC093591]|uniref:tyrosine-type recombinase/integrase n=1 Tax=Streptomyces sp. NPDC093591 TaxID=3366044 RepID=UPI003824261A